MRLGQLARKVSVHTTDIVAFLAKQNIVVQDGSNSRISDEHVQLIYDHFAPELLDTPENLLAGAVEDKVEPEPEAVESKAEADVTLAVDETPVTEPAVPVEQIPADTHSEEVPDVIKAPKVELKGLTVLGKIELPSEKKKVETEESTANTEAVSEIPARPVVRQKNARRENRTPERPRKNPVAAQREREAREAEERRKEDALRRKDQRTQYYQNRVKPSVPTRAVRLIDEPLQHASETSVREKPKTLLGRFLRWLTT